MKRPIGITILSILFAIGGFGLFAIIGMYHGQLGKVAGSIGLPTAYILIAILILAGLGSSGAIGMWLGKKWGWCIGAVYLLYVCFLSLQAAIEIPSMAAEFGQPTKGVAQYYVRYIGRATIHGLCLLYLFKSNVTEFFQLGNVNLWKRFTIVFAITTLIFGLFYMAVLVVANG